MYTDSVCCNELMAHRGSCQCCLKCPNSSAYMLLFHIMSLLLQLFFQLYALFQNKKSLSSVGFQCRLQANRIIHHGGIQTTYAAYSLHSNRYDDAPAHCMQGQHRLPEAPAAVPWPVLPPAGGACACCWGGRCSRAGPTRTSAEAATALARDGWPPLPAVCVWGGVFWGRVCVRAY